MGSGKGVTAQDPTLEAAQTSNANALTNLLTQQSSNSQTLFNLGQPGLQQSENFFQSLASGDPNAIATAIAPAAQQIQQATAGAKQNILSTSPAGGTRNLAIQQADVDQGAQVGSLASQGYTSAFPALAQIGGQNVGQGISSAGAATSAGSAANSAYGSVVQENIQQKGQTLGAIGGLAGDVAGIGGAAFGAAGGAGGFSSLFS